ncbi:MAG: hypothetical protein ACOX1P_03800 [Thermoguttaceae bacterium]|jgi:hypothetical protein
MDVPHVVHLALPGHPLWGAATVRTVSGQNFGLVVAYLLPGFVALWGVSCFSPTVRTWIMASHPKDPTVAGFMYVTLASLGAGMTVSAVRWALIDQIHHATGIKPPVWRFANLEGNLRAYQTLVEYHYRYYQFYSNMFTAAAFTYVAKIVSSGSVPPFSSATRAAFLALEAVLFIGSRDALRRYYTRTRQLLNSRHL